MVLPELFSQATRGGTAGLDPHLQSAARTVRAPDPAAWHQPGRRYGRGRGDTATIACRSADKADSLRAADVCTHNGPRNHDGPCAQIRLGQITHACLSLSRTCILGARISSQVRVISISTNLDLDPVIQTHRLIRFLATSRPRALAPLAPGAWPPRLSQARIAGCAAQAAGRCRAPDIAQAFWPTGSSIAHCLNKDSEL